jgi:Ca2+-binding RTX toxin-like protein
MIVVTGSARCGGWSGTHTNRGKKHVSDEEHSSASELNDAVVMTPHGTYDSYAGTADDDTITGTTKRDFIFGGDGDDVLTGQAGALPVWGMVITAHSTTPSTPTPVMPSPNLSRPMKTVTASWCT